MNTHKDVLIDIIVQEINSVPGDFWADQRYPIQWEEEFAGSLLLVEISTLETSDVTRLLGVSIWTGYDQCTKGYSVQVNTSATDIRAQDWPGKPVNRLALFTWLEEIVDDVKKLGLEHWMEKGLPLIEDLNAGRAVLRLGLEISEFYDNGAYIKARVEDESDGGATMIYEFFVNRTKSA